LKRGVMPQQVLNMSQELCSSCGRAPYVPLEACPHCGRKDAIAHVKGLEVRTELGEVGAVAKRVDRDLGTAEVTVHSPSGWSVVGRLNANGVAELRLVGQPPVGKRNQLHTAKTLSAALSSSLGITVSYEEGADDRGEDVILVFPGGKRQTVQITTALADQSTWSAVARASTTASGHVFPSSVAGLAAELYRAIQSKAHVGPREKSTLWLALDARFVPIAAWQEVINAYLSRHPSPCREFGFADVWVVGPTPFWCQSLCVPTARETKS
jgi:hypothetical protein